MKIHVLSWLLFFLAPGGCPIYSINVSTLEVPANDFKHELTLHTSLSSELQQYRDGLNGAASLRKNNFATKVVPSAGKRFPFLGTNLFDGQRKSCFSMEEVALMSARRTFEQLVPKFYPNCLFSDSLVHMLIRFVSIVNRIVQEMSDEDTRRLPQRAFYDALGGYLRYYLLPAAQVSYYAGRLKLNTMQSLLKIKRQSYIVLNTNGNAWRSPAKDIICQLQGFKIEPLELGDPKFEDGAASCSKLDQSSVLPDADQGQMIVPLPQLEPVDSEGHLSNIFLPFRQRRIYNLRSPTCSALLVRFFRTVTNCHRFQGISQASYNHKLLSWIQESVRSHYLDEMFYPGLGGILQIQETLLHLAKEPEKPKEEAQQDKNCYAAESHKVSRSTDHLHKDYEPSQEDQHADADTEDKENEGASSQAHEECRECDSNNTLIWFIAAFLVLLLIIILLIIFCCMRRGRRRGGKDRTKHVPIDVEAPPSLKSQRVKESPQRAIESPKRVKKRLKASLRPHPYYGIQDNIPDNSSSSLNCQLKKKCFPTKLPSTKGNSSYYRLISEETSPKRQLVSSLRAVPSDMEPSSEIEDRESMRKPKSRHSQEKRQKGRREGGRSAPSRTAKTSADRKNSSPLERRRANRARHDTDEDESDNDPQPHRKRRDESRSRHSTRQRGGGKESSAHSVKDTPSWETTFEDI